MIQLVALKTICRLLPVSISLVLLSFMATVVQAQAARDDSMGSSFFAESRQSGLLPISDAPPSLRTPDDLPPDSLYEGSLPPTRRFGRPWFDGDPNADRGSLFQRLEQPNKQWLPRFPLPDFSHRDPDDPLKHTGRGNPLVGTSWLNRPYHFGLFAGGMFGDSLIDGRISQGNDFFSGFRLGWDFDHYWGGEARAAFTKIDTFDLQNPSNQGVSENVFLDASLLYYPWGDSAMRPYLSLGMGTARFDFVDDQNRQIREALFHLPLGIGLKYHMSNWMSLRFGLMDNVAFGSSLTEGMHNFSVSAGTEFHFGGRRRKYYPFHP